MIVQRGIARVSADDIAARAGCSRATFYRHVGSKAAVVDSIVARATQSLIAQIGRMIAGVQGSNRVVEMILAAIAATRADPITLRVVQHGHNVQIQRHLSSPEVLDAALRLAGLPADDYDAATIVVRIVWSLIHNPVTDSASERRLVERFIDPAFNTTAR